MSEHARQTPLPTFSREIVTGVADHLAHIDYAISTYAHDWAIDRLPAVDRAILRGAVWELLYAEDAEAGVVIDQAVRLAKALSTARSPSFINGVLDTVAAMKPGLLAQESGWDNAAERAESGYDDPVMSPQEEAEYRVRSHTEVYAAMYDAGDFDDADLFPEDVQEEEWSATVPPDPSDRAEDSGTITDEARTRDEAPDFAREAAPATSTAEGESTDEFSAALEADLSRDPGTDSGLEHPTLFDDL